MNKRVRGEMLKTLKLLFILTTLSATIGMLAACSSLDRKLDTPEEVYKYAQELDSADRYQAAIQRYTEVKNKFPYSSYAVLSELAIADAQYKNADYAEAQVSYQNFRELHPTHPKIDYVVFRIGMSYFQQLPETFDRDVTLANDAIYNFNDLIKRFPRSDYYADAQEYRRKAFTMLNEKELYIADFYFKHEQYDSALLRYESSINKYPGFGLEPRSLMGAIKSARYLNDDDKVKEYTDTLLSKFGESDEAKQIKSEVKSQ